MDQHSKSKPVLVTGGTGYIASWIIHDLLKNGWTVHTTVRDKENQEKYQHLLDIAGKSKGKLEVFEADLLQEGAFSEAMENCQFVLHTASPFKVNKIKDPLKELIEPAVKGTRNVLNSVNKSRSVKRVVLTSSVAAIYGDAVDLQDYSHPFFTEKHWNRSSSEKHQPYSYSKTMAEREAWKMYEVQHDWELIVINPGFVMGPSLTPRTDSTSIQTILDMVSGKYKSGVPKLYFGIVDVREVARAHISAALNEDASGRHILVSESMGLLDLANLIREDHSELPLPKSYLPKFILYLVGPFMGFSWDFIEGNIGHEISFDNTYSIEDLGLEYRPVKDTLNDQVKQLKERGKIK
ncbi:MAG: SDR family oxidoreductase [Candidatus Cyclobacteriaceae bacterium M3_2C_046]